MWTDTTGASNVKSADDVPITPLTVSAGRKLATDPAAARPHVTTVAVVHDVVAHSAAICTDAVTSVDAKLRPLIVTVEPPEVAPFTLVADVTIGSTVHTS